MFFKINFVKAVPDRYCAFNTNEIPNINQATYCI